MTEHGTLPPAPDPAAGATERRWRLKDLRRNARYYAIVPLIAVFSRLPLPVARWLGNAAGLVGWALAAKERRRAMENLRAAFGSEKSPGKPRRICRGVFRNTLVNAFELLVVHRWPAEKIRRVFPLGEEFRRLHELMPEGGLGLTAHIGSWELLGFLFAVFLPGYIVPVAKRIYFPKFQDLVERLRGGVGLQVIYTDESPRKQVNALKEGHLLGLLPDQNLKAINGVFVDFFGRPAYTSTTPAHLALMTGKDFLPCFLLRDGKGGFQLRFRRVPVVKTGRREEDLLENTRRWTAVLEEEIRGAVDQWVWFHRRWRTRPEDGPRKFRRRREVESRQSTVDSRQHDGRMDGRTESSTNRHP